MSNQSQPASWLGAARVAVATGPVVLFLGQLCAGSGGWVSLVLSVPLIPIAAVFGLATLVTIVLMWAGRPLGSDAPIVFYGVWLSLEYIAIAALGVPAIYGRTSMTASDGWALMVVGVALAAIVGATTLMLRPAPDPVVRR